VGPGGTTTVLLQALSAGTGSTQDLFVVVDSTDEIAETSESNNARWAETSGSGGGGGTPNLMIAFFGGYSDLEEGVTIYWVDVTNETTADAGSFYVDIFHDSGAEPEIDTTGDQYQRVSDLGAGLTEYLEFSMDELCEYCESWTLIDSFDEVAESNEADNTDMTDITPL
jgi:hypothetical protein